MAQDTPYPTAENIRGMFTSAGNWDYDAFWSHVSPDFEWSVMGSSIVSGTFRGIEEFKANSMDRITRAMKGPVRPRVVNIAGGGVQEWVAIESEFEGEFKNGRPYNQCYAWFLRFDRQGKVVQVKAYLDTALIDRGLAENE
ncbi:uncharacterized protein BDZ99DRAFT_568642 [Mytilinidion resinicola]|uniref:SnoaL-like domain-containing protein n=1 Tax=Mytilinidion resinicola TaxID=574789 RepID=A0A6A6YY66_9PEZI|nr:uncharacterized protein BDZ99DRAFT_568642 [Mytilinidion resinicola]KAF2813439.1 hypothetical protein BDZ99DRAFT_568642 [Mytilinidion resinicola]